MNAPTPKQKILQAVENLPDNATLEDAIERLCFLAKVEEGLRQSTVGEVVSHQDAVRQLLG
jgi:predicted transcriptional regulator